MARVVVLAVACALVLVPAASARSPLRPGAHGPAVRTLELELAWHGFPSGRIDGRFGPRLAGALRRFQRSAGLAPSGVAGRATLAALRRRLPHSPIPLG